MDVAQMYETTIMDTDGRLGFTALVIPARSSLLHSQPREYFHDIMYEIAEIFHAEIQEGGPRYPVMIDDFVCRLLGNQYPDEHHWAFEFAMYVTFSKLIPFEASPLGAESLATIAGSSAKAGTIAIGVTVGYLSAGGMPMLLVAVPAGIVLCGAAVSFGKWLEENRGTIWDRLILGKRKGGGKPKKEGPQDAEPKDTGERG